jgi:hypothetical protein
MLKNTKRIKKAPDYQLCWFVMDLEKMRIKYEKKYAGRKAA